MSGKFRGYDIYDLKLAKILHVSLPDDLTHSIWFIILFLNAITYRNYFCHEVLH